MVKVLLGMSNPFCPRCGSSRIVSGYPLSAGTNKCHNCLFVGPTRAFHEYDAADVMRRVIETARLKASMQIMAQDIVKLPLTVRKREPDVPKEEPHIRKWWLDD